MIYLWNCRDNIKDVAGEWELELRNFLFEKPKRKDGSVYGNCYYDRAVIKLKKSGLDDADKCLKELNWFKNHFRGIVLADEKELDKYSKKKVSESMKTFMTRLYKDFTQHKYNKDNKNDENGKKRNGVSNSHHFFRKLEIRTCPYCNRHYTFTLDEETAKVAPEYDHFYDKSNHPLVAVSFFNLVPSCHSCNHTKGTKSAKINPYFSGFTRKFELQNEERVRMTSVEIVHEKKVGKIGFGKLGESEEEKKRAKEEQKNINTFGLQGLYEMHDDYISELVGKVIAYNPIVRQALVDAFQDQAYSPQQVYDFVWGRYLEEAQYGKRPLSKLTKDILEQLGILPDNDFH